MHCVVLTAKEEKNMSTFSSGISIFKEVNLEEF
jgi:hypothetical protein